MKLRRATRPKFAQSSPIKPRKGFGLLSSKRPKWGFPSVNTAWNSVGVFAASASAGPCRRPNRALAPSQIEHPSSISLDGRLLWDDVWVSVERNSRVSFNGARQHGEPILNSEPGSAGEEKQCRMVIMSSRLLIMSTPRLTTRASLIIPNRKGLERSTYSNRKGGGSTRLSPIPFGLATTSRLLRPTPATFSYCRSLWRRTRRPFLRNTKHSRRRWPESKSHSTTV